MAARNMIGDAKTALKDLKADLISLKHETQACIMDASMRKAVLGESERLVKEDIHEVRLKLEKIVKTLEQKARQETIAVVQKEREEINSEIVGLEEQHKSIEEIEEYVKSKTSNTSMKPVKDGRDKCEVYQQLLDEYKIKANRKNAQFVLHSLLTYLLEQMETFTMGQVILVPVTDDNDEDADEHPGALQTEFTNVSLDPHHTTFMRSNSSKLIEFPGKTAQKGSSRQTSARSDKSSVVVSKPVAKQLEKSKAMKRINTDGNNKEKVKINEEKVDPYRAIVGLRATLATRSTTAPLINLMSTEQSVFATSKKTYVKPPKLKYRETLKTIEHKTACYITGLTALSNGNVIVCDNVHDSLQLYSPGLQSISELQCPHPWGVTAISDSAVAVSLHYDHKIILVKASDILERLNEKDIVLKCNASLTYDVKYYDYRLYVLCINSDIHVLDLKGRECKIIKTRIAQNMLNYLDVDVEHKQVVVSGENGIACVNFEGLPLWKYRSPAKSKITPTGVMVIKGHLLVCDWVNHSIAEIYENGQARRTIFSGGIEKPVAICASSDGASLFVSQGDYDMPKNKAMLVKVMAVEEMPPIEK